MKWLLLFNILFFTSPVSAQTIGLQPFATGFTSPVEIAHPPGDSRLFVVQQGGSISILNTDGTVNPIPFLTLSSSVVISGGERGLLGLAFHPNYTANGYFYINYTRAGDGATVIARYSVSTDPNIADPLSGTILLTIDQPFANHNGGTVKFGPDGYLYIGMGDGGSAGDPGNRAQNINENLGKMLRINVNGSPYGIPPSNPYVGVTGNDEIWAIGLRNPWKFSFNRLNGDLWIADVGQNAIEEINKITAPLPNTGLNFGWRCYEGNSVYNTSSGNCPSYIATVAPIDQYTHASGRCAVTGGYVYTGALYPKLKDKYFFADYCTGEIGTIDNSGTLTWGFDATGNITTFGEDKNGELYAAVGNVIYKIVDTSLKVKDVKKNDFRFYPNPAKTEIIIDTDSNILINEIKIFDLTGKLVLSDFPSNKNIPRINVSHLSKGLYILSVEDSDGNVSHSQLIVE